MKKIIFVFILIFPFITFAQLRISKESKDGKFISNTVIFKIKTANKSFCNKEIISDEKINQLFKNISASKPKQKFPFSKPGKSGSKTIDISTIYEINYTENISIEKVISDLKKNPLVEYAIPHYIQDPLYVPNDSLLFRLYYLDLLKVYDAWDVCKGDTNITIAISDWGTDHGHGDLINNVAYNYNDPLDGTDNDNDGYIDNFRGWDFGDNDNDAQANCQEGDGSIENHGVWVSGMASASTDNVKGVAGTGFKCRFIHLKVSQQTPYGCYGTGCYESIVYAADHGYDIINCSCGDSVNFNAYGQEIIDYANSKNLLVIASAGNNWNQRLFYPASYNHVMSVAGTDGNDIRHPHSTYGIETDICAPATMIYSTDLNNTYSLTYFGTSFASPIVAGCAGIVKAHYPNFNSEQIREVMKVTADKIDTLAGNIPNADLLGAGRINLYRAVTDSLPPSIIFHSYHLSGLTNTALSGNDTVKLKGLFTNYLTPSSNLTVTMSCNSSNIQILKGKNTLGIIQTMDTVNNFNQAFSFKFKVFPPLPYDVPIRLKFVFTDSIFGYRAVQYYEFIPKPAFVDIDTNHIKCTITANGFYGFSDYYFVNGNGFSYKKSDPLFFDAGFMIGNSEFNLSNCIRQNNDFKLFSGAKKVIPSVVSNQDTHAEFNDNNNPSKLNVKIIQNNYAWSQDTSANFIISEYKIINNNPNTITNLYAGIFADWDISFSYTNKINYNSIEKFSYTYSTLPDGICTGMKLLSAQPMNHYAIDQTSTNFGFINITDDFKLSEKFYVLSNTRHTAGNTTAEGNDVCDVMSAGPFSIAPGDTESISFALIAGENPYILQNAARVAQAKYDSLHHISSVMPVNQDEYAINIFPNPAKNSIEIFITNNLINKTEISIFNLMGTKIFSKITDLSFLNYDCSQLPAGIYFVRIQSENKTAFRKFEILK